MKHARLATIFSFILYSIFLIQGGAIAATESELRERINKRNEQIKQLEEEIAKYQQSLTETSQQSKTLTGEIIRLETEIKRLNADIRLTENRIGATELEIEELDVEIAGKERDIERNKAVLGAALKNMYESETEAMMFVLLKNNKVSDFFTDLEHIQDLEKSVQENLSNLKSLKIGLEEERTDKEGKKNDLARLRHELDDKKGIHKNAQGQKKTLLTDTKNKEATYKNMLQVSAEQRRLVLEEIQKTEDELRKLIDRAALPESHSGVLSWPIKGKTILTQSFGSTPDSKILYNGKPHNGIDIAAPTGTPLHAAEAGVVKETGDTDAFTGCLSYGKWVLIEHPNKLSTLYAHLSLIKLSKGQSVARDELIGYSGATGYATGPHLHFTVYDSNTVQFKASNVSGSQCKFLPYGGYLNPLAYL